MPRIDLVVQTNIVNSPRVMQLSGMFDVPLKDKLSKEWHLEVPLDERDWNIGLIVGPSGSGKTRIAHELFPDQVDVPLQWGQPSVIDDFSAQNTITEITDAVSAVGFNSIPSWMLPFHHLSNGQQFRVTLARRLLELESPVVVDEFSSVVDRQVAQIASHAVQKWARKTKKKFVAVTCHYDVLDWLQPDWVIDASTPAFDWRSLQRHPPLELVIGQVPYAAWKLFAPYHYLTNQLSNAARCFGLWVNGELAGFQGILHLPHPRRKNIKRLSRSVILPDYQGMGLIHVMGDFIGSAYKAIGYELRSYPAHPAYVRAKDKSPKWQMTKKPGRFLPSQKTSVKSTLSSGVNAGFGGRPNAVFRYVGPAHPDPDWCCSFTGSRRR